MKRKYLNPLGGEIADGNIDLSSVKEEVAWKEKLRELGFTKEELAEVMASNSVHQWLRDLGGKRMEVSKKDVLDALEFYRKMHKDLEGLLNEMNNGSSGEFNH